MVENNWQLMMMNVVNLLSVRVDGLLKQFYRVVRLLFEESQKVMVEFQELKGENNKNSEKVKV